MLARLGLGLTVLLAPLGAARADDAPPVQVKPIASASTTASGQPIRLPQGDVTVALSEFTIAPGAKLPVHQHPYPRLGYVLSGELTVTQTETGKSTVYRAGDLIVEVVGEWHFGANTGSEPVRLLVLDEAPTGAKTTVLQTP